MTVIRRRAVLAAEMHRHSKSRPKSRRRQYSTLGSAIAGCSKWAALDGYVGDVVVLYDIQTGLEVGTLKVTAVGKIITSWIWEEQQ